MSLDMTNIKPHDVKLQLNIGIQTKFDTITLISNKQELMPDDKVWFMLLRQIFGLGVDLDSSIMQDTFATDGINYHRIELDLGYYRGAPNALLNDDNAPLGCVGTPYHIIKIQLDDEGITTLKWHFDVAIGLHLEKQINMCRIQLEDK